MKHGGKMMVILSKCTHISINIDRKSIINTSVNHILPDKPARDFQRH